ncbi:MAG: ABC transporter permease [Actinobacteria bacterium]|nr:ABC transporter permease [Actinomycetota bacterium]
MRVLRNVFRRKLRSSLTIFGITIGVFALVVMGAMAEKINLLIDGGTKYYGDKVMVAEATAGNFSVRPLSLKKVEEIREVKGVADAFPQVYMMLDPEQNMSFGMPKMLVSGDLKANKYEEKKWKIGYVAGRKLKDGDIGKSVVGADLVKDLNAKVGKKIKVRGKEFEVVGIMEKTLTAPDSTVSILLPDAQDLFVKSLPVALQKTVKKEDLITSIVVYPKPGEDPGVLAKRINKEVKEVKATGPAEFRKQTGQAMVIFNTIIFGIGAISLLVGGLSVINTMMMSVSERTREIGIKKAIGASNRRIIREFLGEAATIGGIGGLLGLSLGWAFVQAVNSATAGTGTVVFLVTGRLAIGATLFAIALGAFAGLYPAWHAARLNPVKALRYE